MWCSSTDKNIRQSLRSIKSKVKYQDEGLELIDMKWQIAFVERRLYGLNSGPYHLSGLLWVAWHSI